MERETYQYQYVKKKLQTLVYNTWKMLSSWHVFFTVLVPYIIFHSKEEDEEEEEEEEEEKEKEEGIARRRDRRL